MNRRRLCQLAVQWSEAAGGMRQVLANVASAMRRRRGVQVRGKPAAWEDDAELQPLLDADDALGQVYQALRAPELEAAYRASNGRKFTAAEIPAVTQLFTPAWVARFLVQNTVGRLWLSIHPDSLLRSKLDLLFDADIVPISPRPVGDLRICDPACGTMNFGLAAIDLLVEMYREEADRAGRPGWPKKPSSPINLRKNIIGFDIDPVALDLARISLAIKLGRPIKTQLICTDSLFDKNIPSHSYDVVVTNPPYLSARNLPRQMVDRMKTRFPAAWRDAYACFLLRSMELLKPQGRAGILAMHSFMFTGGFEKLRRNLTDQAAIEAIAHFGPGLFEVGNPGTLQTAAIILRREPCEEARDGQTIHAWRLVERSDKQAALKGTASSKIIQKSLKNIPRQSWSYWAGPRLLKMFSAHPRLAQVAAPRQGLATTDNARFVRYWWEVEPPGHTAARHRWVPYAKSGRFRRWYEAPRHRVDWEDDGRRIKESIVQRYPYLKGKWGWVAKNTQFYGLPGVTYSYLTSGSFSARCLEAGSIFDVAGSSLFPEDPLVMLAILNSSAASNLLSIINPTVNFQVGDLAQLPVPRGGEHLRPLVSRAIELQKTLDSFDETTTDFISPIPWDDAESWFRELNGELSRLELTLDEQVSDLYGLGDCCRASALAERFDRVELARRWISYALSELLRSPRKEDVIFNAETAEDRGECKTDESVPAGLRGPPRSSAVSALKSARPFGGDVKELPIDPPLLNAIRDRLPSEQIEAAVGSLEQFLDGPFERWHIQLYCRRPIWRIIHRHGDVLISSSL